MKNFIFTSESVCAGHPDKICDQISDAILDAVLAEDKFGRVAVETMAAKNNLYIVGEITSTAKVDFAQVAKNQIRRLGYTHEKYGFSDKSPITLNIHTQSPEISRGVSKKGAGDQGMMFGFAVRENGNFMPMPINIAHKMAHKIDTLRETNVLNYLRPDGKTQITIEYKNNVPHKVLSVVLAVPHSEETDLKTVKHDLYKHVVVEILDEYGFKFPEKEVVVNGTGVWHMSGPAQDCGLTGRKIIVDTYGGYARVGGGAFSGKDPTKVDRSGAYAARYIAKNIVAHNLADRAEVRLAYFIGARKPVMQEVETFGTEKKSQKVIADFMNKLLDTSVEGIIDGLNLRQPIYLKTASYGHFGRSEFPWEKIV